MHSFREVQLKGEDKTLKIRLIHSLEEQRVRVMFDGFFTSPDLTTDVAQLQALAHQLQSAVDDFQSNTRKANGSIQPKPARWSTRFFNNYLKRKGPRDGQTLR